MTCVELLKVTVHVTHDQHNQMPCPTKPFIVLLPGTAVMDGMQNQRTESRNLDKQMMPTPKNQQGPN